MSPRMTTNVAKGSSNVTLCDLENVDKDQYPRIFAEEWGLIYVKVHTWIATLGLENNEAVIIAVVDGLVAFGQFKRKLLDYVSCLAMSSHGRLYVCAASAFELFVSGCRCPMTRKDLAWDIISWIPAIIAWLRSSLTAVLELHHHLKSRAAAWNERVYVCYLSCHVRCRRHFTALCPVSVFLYLGLGLTRRQMMFPRLHRHSHFSRALRKCRAAASLLA